MIRRFLTPLVLVLATSACAQASQRDYESMGTMSVTIEGAAHELWVPFLTDEGEAYAELSGPVASCLFLF